MSNVPAPDGDEEIVFQGQIIEVVRQNMKIGTWQSTFEWARRSPGTRLIIPSSDGKQMLLTKEHRRELGGWDYRLPGGKVYDSLNEYNDALKKAADILKIATERAKIEAEEEAGIKVALLKHFATATCGATVQWDLFYFVVEEFTKLPTQSLGSGEVIEITWLDKLVVRELCLAGKISEDRSVAQLLRYLERQDE